MISPLQASRKKERATLVGAGVVNLLTALALDERGFEVEILDAAPDPRSKPSWRLLGATHGGENARMFSYAEANCYRFKPEHVLRKTISEGGWLVEAPEALTPAEKAWIEEFYAVSPERAKTFQEDIHGFNVASASLWDELRRERPELFEDVGIVDGLLQIYSQAEQAAAAKELHHRLDSLKRSLDLDGLVESYPSLRVAAEQGEIAGALEVRGFTLNVHDFAARVLSFLEERGVRATWNRRVEAIERDASGKIAGLRTDDEIVRSEHYVLSPGAYAGELLQGMQSRGKIHGMLGLWISLPHLEPQLGCSIKIHREGAVGEDSNVVLGEDPEGRPLLLLGSGYGYLGDRPLDLGSPEIEPLYQALEETARRYFPAAYEQARRGGMLQASRRACVRPFTSTGLGVFEVESTVDDGRLIVASGHNTGGFAQSPVVAQAVAATLAGEEHPMQALYAVERAAGVGRRVGAA